MIISSVIIFKMSLYASVKVIYGEDNRKDHYEASQFHLDLANSTAAMISSSSVSVRGDKAVITGSTLSSRGICSTERFADQITAASCSGFLVAPDLLVTAGHCIENASDCRRYSWVFDYAVKNPGDLETTRFETDSSNVYECKRVIESVLTRGTQDDYALIQLDRVVKDRTPLKVRRSGRIQEGDELVVIGHPSGLPSKIADGSTVRSLSGKYFTADLDTYGGNSGSAVFNARTGEVEGILVRGDTDYVRSSRGCRVSNVIGQNAGRGEDVTYITNLSHLLD